MRSALVLVAALFSSSAALAHTPGVSGGEYRLHDGVLQAKISFSKTELSEELSSYQDAAKLFEWLAVSATVDGQRCTFDLPTGQEEEEDGYVVFMQARCRAEKSGVLHVDLGFIDRLPPGHRHFALGKAGGALIDVVTHRRQPSLDIPVVVTAAPWWEAHRVELGAVLGLALVLSIVFGVIRARRKRSPPGS